MTNASIAIYVGRPRRPILGETMMVVTPTCINSRRAQRKKLSAKRLWRVVRSRRSAMTVNNALLRLIRAIIHPMPQMRTFFEVILIPERRLSMSLARGLVE